MIEAPREPVEQLVIVALRQPLEKIGDAILAAIARKGGAAQAQAGPFAREEAAQAQAKISERGEAAHAQAKPSEGGEAAQAQAKPSCVSCNTRPATGRGVFFAKLLTKTL